MKKSNLETLRQSVDDLKKDKDIMEQTSSEEINKLNSKNKKLTTLIENIDDRLEGLRLTLPERSILEIHLLEDTRVAAVDHNHLARLYPTLQG